MQNGNIYKRLIMIAALIWAGLIVAAQENENRSFKIFQFPPNRIPSIDGNKTDWNIVPDSFLVGTNQLVEDNKRFPAPDPKNLDVKVKVGWVKGLNRLYFLYEAYDDYWDFTHTGLHNDIFEIVVDADRSGGPLIDEQHPNPGIEKWEAYFSFHGVHAQNYHIFTPAEGKDWALAWGSQPWIKDLPYANAAYNYDFKPGDSGRLVLEFWITPFDYAGAEGPVRAVESNLFDNKIISLSWAVIDYDDVNDRKKQGFWNLSRQHKMYGNASYLLPFTLMPLDSRFKKSIDAQWSFKVVDMKRRLVSFIDESEGQITSWKWDFGDNTTSTQQHPSHQYKDAGKYVVTLWIEGPAGKSRRAKVWDVAVR
ncbi:MAG: PKD domain-containing protein [Ferruginibacter sp.]|nr:PKD domain-containing protein [Chitinophagaceae bacterium]